MTLLSLYISNESINSSITLYFYCFNQVLMKYFPFSLYPTAWTKGIHFTQLSVWLHWLTPECSTQTTVSLAAECTWVSADISVRCLVVGYRLPKCREIYASHDSPMTYLVDFLGRGTFREKSENLMQWLFIFYALRRLDKISSVFSLLLGICSLLYLFYQN